MTATKSWTILCGCKVKIYAPGDSVEVVHCPLHRNAKPLLDALRTLLIQSKNMIEICEFESLDTPTEYGAIAQAESAIAAAGG